MPVSEDFKREMMSEESGEAFLSLVTIDLDPPDPLQLPTPIRLVNNTEAISRSGASPEGAVTYQPFPFELNLPPQSGNKLPTVVLRIDAVDNSLIATIRTLQRNPTVTMRVISTMDLDVDEIGPLKFRWRDTTYDVRSIEAQLQYEDILNEPFPAHRFTPQTHPGLF